MKTTLIPTFCLIVTVCFSCKTEEIILHGELSGRIIDAITSQPLENATVIIPQLNDTTHADSGGHYYFKNLVPSNYEIDAVLSPGYAIKKKIISVTEAKMTEINFELNGIPKLKSSAMWINFGLDSTFKTFTISNIGKGRLSYALISYQNWITIDPIFDNEVTTQSDTIKVTINRIGLPTGKHMEIIGILSIIENDYHIDTISVLVNGLLDRDQKYNSKLKNYYGVVTIGTQTWMEENLNIGTPIPITQEQKDNGIIEKWCYDCNTYGGLYNWHEMMNYSPADFSVIGITQGICPIGWHIPTFNEWTTLFSYLGGNGGKLKTTDSLWQPPNVGATNETGFNALPGGSALRGDKDLLDPNPSDNYFGGQGLALVLWSSYLLTYDPTCSTCPEKGYNIPINTYFTDLGFYDIPTYWGTSVRCIKDPSSNK
jgi:uncharacterized protein (TIGR02145 family)